MRHKQSSLFSFDIFAGDIKMNLAGGGSVGTKVGLGLTIAYASIFSALSYIILSDFLDKSKPKISQTVVSQDQKPEIRYKLDKMLPMLYFAYRSTNALKLPELNKFVTLQFAKYSMTKSKETGALVASWKEFDVVPCADLIAQGRFGGYSADPKVMSDPMVLNSVCVDTKDDDMIVGGPTFQPGDVEQVLFKILPCTLPSGCVPREELARVTFGNMSPKPILDLGNPDSPVRHLFEIRDMAFLSIAFTNRQSFNIMKAEVINEAGMFFADKVAQSYAVIDSSSSSLTDRDPNKLSCAVKPGIVGTDCVPYFLQSTFASPQKLEIKRQYKGVVETFSEFGGMVDMLFLIFFFPYAFYNSRAVREKTVAEVYGIERPKKPRRNQTSTPEAQQQYLEEAEKYSRLLEATDDFFDVGKMARELNNARLLVQMLLPESIGFTKKPSELHAALADDQPSKTDLVKFKELKQVSSLANPGLPQFKPKKVLHASYSQVGSFKKGLSQKSALSKIESVNELTAGTLEHLKSLREDISQYCLLLAGKQPTPPVSKPQVDIQANSELPEPQK